MTVATGSPSLGMRSTRKPLDSSWYSSMPPSVRTGSIPSGSTAAKTGIVRNLVSRHASRENCRNLIVVRVMSVSYDSTLQPSIGKCWKRLFSFLCKDLVPLRFHSGRVVLCAAARAVQGALQARIELRHCGRNAANSDRACIPKEVFFCDLTFSCLNSDRTIRFIDILT